MTNENEKIKIMVVDGYSTMRRIVKTLLRQNGYKHFVDAKNSQVAREALLNNPDIGFLVADWKLTDASGGDFLKEVRKIPGFNKTPYLLVAADQDKQDALTAINADGRSQIIIKPFTGMSLKEKMVAPKKNGKAS